MTPYVNLYTTDFYLERGKAPWPRVLSEAADWARQMGDWDSVMRYDGIIRDARISDEREDVHSFDEWCADYQGKKTTDPDFTPCCRTATVYAFHVGTRGE